MNSRPKVNFIHFYNVGQGLGISKAVVTLMK